MNKQLQKELILMNLEVAVKNFGKIISIDDDAIYCKNESTGNVKRVTFKFMSDATNKALNKLRK